MARPQSSPTTPAETPEGSSAADVDAALEAPLGSSASEAETEPVLVEEDLLAELPTFETFFKTFGFKRVHGRVWGLLVLARRPLSSKEIASTLGISQGATSTTLSELSEWGAISSRFDSQRRCNLHAPVGNALSIVATVFRRREQVVFQQFRQTAERSLAFIRERHGEKDPRVLTLRSILTTCDIGEAVMQLVFSAVQNAMTDPESLLSRAVNAAFKVGVGLPARVLLGHPLGQAPEAPLPEAPLPEAEAEDPADDATENGAGSGGPRGRASTPSSRSRRSRRGDSEGAPTTTDGAPGAGLRDHARETKGSQAS